MTEDELQREFSGLKDMGEHSLSVSAVCCNCEFEQERATDVLRRRTRFTKTAFSAGPNRAREEVPNTSEAIAMISGILYHTAFL
jgi:hypothetical protein